MHPGNGYFATRGAAPEARADGIHYPGTYLAGGYNRLRTEIGGQALENEDLVNLPNWLPLLVRPAGGEWIHPETVEFLDYRQSLDLRRGILERTFRCRDGAGRVTRVAQRRFVHMASPHLAGLSTGIVAENWSGAVEIRSVLDGRVVNDGVARYRGLQNDHLEPLRAESTDRETILLAVRTSQSRLEVALAARTRLFRGAERLSVEPRVLLEARCAAHEFGMTLGQGETLTVEKIVALHTGRDHAICEPALEALTAVGRAGDFGELAQRHALAWEHLWSRFDIDAEETDPRETERTARILRLHVFHLLQTASPNTMDLDTGVPARGWHGEAYRGHVFWDELFIFPLLNLRLPKITRALLMYRYRRLGEARANARAAGCRGALYPWQSGSNGREESQRLHRNPRSGRWVPDPTWLQRHINAAIAYNVWQYYQVTRDMEFLSFAGAEMFLEIARFWASVSTYNAENDRYEIRGVVGPDEFHTAYPDRDRPGLDNQAYTNVMAVWVLSRALELLGMLPAERRLELKERLDLRDEELSAWDEISRKMRLVFHADGILSQFEGYERLAEFDWEGYRRRYGDIHRLDRILEAEGDTPNRYKASKQADVLMLFYLFSSEELRELFRRLGYPFRYETIPRTLRYYARRTSHGSTLSRVVYSWVTARSDRAGSWRLFKEALESDVADIQGGTTPEGIHLGAMAGTVDLLQRCYTGIVTRGDILWLNPCLPRELARLEMTIRYRGHALRLALARDVLTVSAHESNAAPIRVGFRKTRCTLKAGETRTFAMPPAPPAPRRAGPRSPRGERPRRKP